MSAATVATAPAEAPAEAKGGKKKLLIIIGVVVLLVLGAAYKFVLAPAPAEDVDAAPIEGEVVPLEALTTTTGSAALHHARVALALVLSEGADAATVTARAPLLQDALLREVATMDADQLRSPEGSDRLRTALTEHAQTIWTEGEVLRVVLTELLVQ